MASTKRRLRTGLPAGRHPSGSPSAVEAAASTAPSPPLPTWTHFIVGLAIVLVCVLSYSNNLNGKLVLDDRGILAGNEHIRSLTNVPSLFRMNWWAMTPVKGAGAVYRPLAATSYAVDVQLMGGYSAKRELEDPYTGGLNMRVLHRSSLIYHCVASLLVYLLLLQVPLATYRNVAAGWGALIFAAHPVHVEAVSNHVGRTEILAGLFFFASAAVFLAGNRQRDRLSMSALAGLLWLAALLCKEMAVTLPAALVIGELFWKKKRSLRQWAMIYSPFLVAAGIYFVLRHQALAGQKVGPFFEALPSATISYGERMLTMTHAFAWYWLLLLAPVPAWLSADYSGFPVSRTIFSPTFLVGLAGVGITVALALHGWRSRNRPGRRWLALVAIGVVSVYGLLLPVSNVFFNTGVVVSERALYIPSLGLALVAAATLETMWRRFQSRPARGILVGMASILIVGLVLGCRSRNRVWADERALFFATVKHPYCGQIGINGLTAILVHDGKYEEALPYLRRSFALQPTETSLQREVVCLLQLEKYSEAIRPLEILVHNKLQLSENLSKLGQCYLKAGRTNSLQSLLKGYPQLAADPQFAPFR